MNDIVYLVETRPLLLLRTLHDDAGTLALSTRHHEVADQFSSKGAAINAAEAYAREGGPVSGCRILELNLRTGFYDVAK